MGLVAFQAFLQDHGKSLNSRGLQAARTLEISHSFAMIYLSASTVNPFIDEMVWDGFIERYEHVVPLAALIIESSTSDNCTRKRGPDFTLDMNIVAPLYIVAHKCRHPVIRRKAVSLLYAAPRQEGVWDSILSARVAERLIGIEETGLAMSPIARMYPTGHVYRISTSTLIYRDVSGPQNIVTNKVYKGKYGIPSRSRSGGEEDP